MEEKPDLSKPEGLVRAVFDALRREQADAFVDLTVSRKEDFEFVSRIFARRNVPTDDELASGREKRKEHLRGFIAELRSRGIDPARVRIVLIRTDRAVVGDGVGFAEDLTLVLSSGDTQIPVTLDDCVLTDRGWLILDGLRLREGAPIPGPNCALLFAAWRRDLAGEGGRLTPEAETELRSRAERFPCEIMLDLDGDRRPDSAYITGSLSGQVGIGLRWGDGRRSVLGAGQPMQVRPVESEDGPGETLRGDSLDWLVDWSVAPLRRGAFEVKVLGKVRRFAAPTALGDGIQVSGSDAAAILFLDREGWCWVHLGY